jgi:NDP-sugar pyrophosphorylase family protein
MKAMILAGGLSTRLYPLTKQVPKPLVPIANEPNAAWVMRYLHAYGIDEIAINVHYHAEAIETRLRDGSQYGVRLHYLHEPELLGSAGAVKQMETFFDDTFVVVGCDDLTDARLDELIAFHRSRRALATIGLVRAADVSQYGVVVVDGNGRIVEFQEKPAPGTERSHLVNTGIYVFEPGIFARIPPDTFYDFGKQVFGELLRDGLPFYGMELAGAYWCDIGTPAEYRRASDDVLAGKVRLAGGGIALGVSPDAVVGEGARIEGSVLVGRGAHVGDRATIEGPSVVGDGAIVGAGAVLSGAIVWEGAVIGADARVNDSVVGANYHLSAGAVLDGAVVANEEAAV